MSAAGEAIPVKMVREDLENIPHFNLPAGYSLRAYEPGDEAHWLGIHLAADHYNSITPELFQAQFGSDPVSLAQRQFYLLDAEAKAIGTGTAWFNDHFKGRRFGRVHWVAILPEFQRHGLAKPLMTAICTRLRELGHQRAYLTTATARLPAIKLYLHFGFVPLIANQTEEVVWRGLLSDLAPNPAESDGSR
ncbi:MAG: GNAT family N-acetyltransferase [Verrucomicrobia bacterium]|nr:MAG: GNAT family N-acetyltransferase [Verrucomicrobiota bacterium]